MNETPSLLSQHRLHYEHTEDYTFLNRLFGEYKRAERAVKAHQLTLPLVTSSMRRIFKTK